MLVQDSAGQVKPGRREIPESGIRHEGCPLPRRAPLRLELDDRLAITPDDREKTGSETVYRARLQGQPVALVMTATAPDGYSGSIRLLVGIRADDTLSGVRVVAHRETPGLGDAIDEQRSDWIFGFDGKSLSDPEPARWAVKKDGGDFDQLTGATITPRAIVKAVKRSLRYYHANREALYAAAQERETQ